MSDRFALHLQTLSSAQAKVLVLGDLVGRRNGKLEFGPLELKRAFIDLQVPPPGNIHQALANLAKRDLVLSKGKGSWSLTPLGREKAREYVADAAPTLADGSVSEPGAEFAHVHQTVIPPWAAPPRWQIGVKRLLDESPFDENVFCMTRFPSEGPTADPVADAVEALKEALNLYGLRLHVASDRLLDDDLFANVGAYMWGCRYGIGIVEDRVGRGMNYNALIELGGMILTGRRCTILKDRTISGSLPTDLASHVYKTVDLDDATTATAQIEQWASKDLLLKKA